MLSRRSALIIIGTLMALETCLIFGQVSHNLLHSKKKLLTDICGPGEINEETAYIQARSSMARAMEVNERMRSWRKNKSGLKRSSILKTLENCGESMSSTPRIRNSRRPSRTRVRSWKHQWLLLCPVKLRKIVGVVHPTKFSQNWRVFWKLMNPQECVWEIRYRIIMKTILQEKVKTHYSTATWFTSLFLCLKPWKFLQRRQWTRNGKNWWKFRRGTWQRSEVEKKLSMKQGRRMLQFILHH